MDFLLKLLPQFLKTVPSASNSAGTALGTLASAALYAYMGGAIWVPPIAAVLAMTPAGLTSLAVVAVGLGVSYLVTHVAEIHNLNDLVAKWMPVILAKFPTGKNGENDDVQSPVSVSPPTDNFNQPVQATILSDNVLAHTVTQINSK